MLCETTLLERARRMDRAALVEIFDLYAQVLYRYALRLCRDTVLADQIVGDVFAKLLEQLAAGTGPRTNLRSYLYTMVSHRVVDEIRYTQRSAALEAICLRHQEAETIQGNVETRVLFRAVLRAIKNDLTTDQRRVIILRFVNGLSLKETAAILGKEPYNVKVIQNRAITALRTALG